MLERALAAEVDEFLGRPRYERRMLAEHGYRNGYGPPRVVKVAQRLEHSWRPLNGGLTVMTLLLGGTRFVDGVYVPSSAHESAA